MNDFRDCRISRDDDIVFIKNKRGEDPRLVFGIVIKADNQSIEVIDDDGITHEVRLSQRSFAAEKMLNVITIPARAYREGNTLDCSGYPVRIGDRVVFMETPSQGFCTSLILGNVVRVKDDGITIQASEAGNRKYMRKPKEVAVIE